MGHIAWRPHRWRKMTLAVAFAATMLAGVAAISAPAGAVTPDPDFYLALGGSASVGFQPTAALTACSEL